MRKIFSDVYFYFVLAIVLTFVIIKIPQLSLAYFWDEAWSYCPAINFMLNHGLGLLPRTIPPDLSVGHPLLFHFGEALWMKIFGTSLAAAKSYPLVLSVLLLFSIYFFCKKFFNRITGVVAVIIFASQEIFIAQSSFVLPEVFLTLLTITSLYFYFSKKKLLYVISASMLVLTKESGVVLILTLIVWRYIEYIFLKEKSSAKVVIKEFPSLFLPLIVFVIYFAIQKLTYGWYFYPVHTGLMHFNWNYFHSAFIEIYCRNLTIDFGRNIMTIFFVFSIVFLLFKRYKPEGMQIKVIVLLFLFMILFLGFSSVNFVSIRYILCIYPIFIILASYFILSAFREYKLLALSILILIVVVKLYFTYTQRNDLDSNLGFADSAIVQKNMVLYCEQNKWQDKNIYTHFLLQRDLTNSNIGYLSDKNNVFKNVSTKEEDVKNSDYCIFSSMEYNPDYEKFKKMYNLKLIKRFELHNCYSEIYQNSH